jgi:hypothetical protein
VTIHATPERVFASLANGDSIPFWMSRGNNVTVHRHGMLVPGDTIRVDLKRAVSGAQTRAVWVVTDVTPPNLLALAVRDTAGLVLATRRDSLIAVADSTRIISTINLVNLDSLVVARGDSVKSSPAMLRMAQNVMVSAFRIDANVGLKQLKTRIESH